MGPSPTYRPPEGEGTETSFEHGLPLWGQTRSRVLLLATEAFPHKGGPPTRGRCIGAVQGEHKPHGRFPPWQPKYREYVRTYLHPASLVTS